MAQVHLGPHPSAHRQPLKPPPKWYERMLGAEVIRSMQQGKPRIDLKLGGANIFISRRSAAGRTASTRPRSTALPGPSIIFRGLRSTASTRVVADLKAKGPSRFTREGPTHRAAGRAKSRSWRAPEGRCRSKLLRSQRRLSAMCPRMRCSAETEWSGCTADPGTATVCYEFRGLQRTRFASLHACAAPGTRPLCQRPCV